MKNFIQLLIFIFFTCNLYASDKVLYPVYSIKLNRINKEIMDTISVEKKEFAFDLRDFGINILCVLKLNLNNLLLFNTKQDSNYTYNLLGKIDINENNKLKFESIANSNEYVLQKQIELKKNIEHINQNNFTFEEIKKILDVDLINEDLGEELYQNKEYNISVEEATKNLINCRFCEQMIDIYSRYDRCEIYSICDDLNSVEVIFLNDKPFEYKIDYEHHADFFEKINKNGNIYNQLNSEFIKDTEK